jgi:hypothetical protein
VGGGGGLNSIVKNHSEGFESSVVSFDEQYMYIQMNKMLYTIPSNSFRKYVANMPTKAGAENRANTKSRTC